jgi:hypothetical protein
MKTNAAGPAISTLVELTTTDEPIRGVRVDEVTGQRMTLTPPSSAAVCLAPGDQVTLYWPAEGRGRYVVTGQVAEMVGTRLVVELGSEPRIEQLRQFVRGGGGEEIRMRKVGTDGAGHAGEVCDISERSVRAQFAAVGIDDGEAVWLTFCLDADTVEVYGTVARVTVEPPEAPGSDEDRTELIVMLDTDEAQAQLIRRYVLRQQMLARARAAEMI